MCGIFNWIFFPIQMHQKTPSKNLNSDLTENTRKSELNDDRRAWQFPQYLYLLRLYIAFVFFIYLIWQQDEINMINEWRFYTSFRETDIKMRRGKTNNKQNFNINKPLPNPWLIKTSPLWMGLILYVQVKLHL